MGWSEIEGWETMKQKKKRANCPASLGWCCVPFPLVLAWCVGSRTLARCWLLSRALLAGKGQVGHSTATSGSCCLARLSRTSSRWYFGWKFTSYMLLINIVKFPLQTRQCFVSSLFIGRVPITIDEQAQRLQAFRNTWDVSSWPTSRKPGQAFVKWPVLVRRDVMMSRMFKSPMAV